jgi:hypothetical protein
MAKVLADSLVMSTEKTPINQIASSQEPSPSLQPAVGKEQGTGMQSEFGGREGPEPTRFGDWEKAGRCIDF